MTIYISAWHARRGTTAASGYGFYNGATKTHPLAELKERRLKYPEDDWVLLWFCEIDGAAFNGYFQDSAEINAGELLSGAPDTQEKP